MKKHSSEIKDKSRLQKDMAMISVSIFAIIGCILVFRSFAAKKFDTTRPGTVPYEALEPEVSSSQLKLKLDIKKGRTYCINGSGYMKLPQGAKNDLNIQKAGQHCVTSLSDGTGELFVNSPYNPNGALTIY